MSAQHLKPVEATLILHFTFAMKQDQDLGKEFVKYLKAAPKLSEFSLALALAASPIHRFESVIFDALKVLGPMMNFSLLTETCFVRVKAY